jgi:hypothetical protein
MMLTYLRMYRIYRVFSVFEEYLHWQKESLVSTHNSGRSQSLPGAHTSQNPSFRSEASPQFPNLEVRSEKDIYPEELEVDRSLSKSKDSINKEEFDLYGQNDS